MQPLPSVDNITAIAALETHEDAIMIAQDEIACLNDMSLEGDIPNNVSDIGGRTRRKPFLLQVKFCKLSLY
jgi:hypothetical protein